MESLEEIARKRLHPSLTDPSFLVLRSRRLIFASWIQDLGDGPLKVLDVGGRYQPYRPLLAGRFSNYVAVDLIQTPMVTVVANGQALPFAPETFDVVIATQVFEYFSDPHAAAKQIHQVLKPGGVLLASLASCLPRIADDDRWRFTAPGVRSLLSPYASVDILPEVGNFGSYLRFTNLAFNFFLPWMPLREGYNMLICPLLNLLGLGLEALNLSDNDQFAANYSVRAIKAR